MQSSGATPSNRAPARKDSGSGLPRATSSPHTMAAGIGSPTAARRRSASERCPDVTMPQLPAGRRASSSDGAAHQLQAVGVELLRRIQARRLGRRVDAGSGLADDVDAAHAVEHGEHGREVEPEARAEGAPLPLDDGSGIHERAVEIEEQRRHDQDPGGVPRDTVDDLLHVAEVVAVGMQRHRSRARHAHLVHIVQVDEQPVGAIAPDSP